MGPHHRWKLGRHVEGNKNVDTLTRRRKDSLKARKVGRHKHTSKGSNKREMSPRVL